MKTVIITGGNINIKFTKEYLKKYSFDLVIVADKGLEVVNKLNITPNYIIGDFDSVNKETLEEYKNNKTQIIKLNPEKDYTDTHMALKLAIEKNSTSIIILGAIGTRIDHTIANIHILKEALEKNIKAKIINSNNEITLINKNIEILNNEKFKYISLIPLTTEVKNITLSGFKYKLEKANLNIGESIGISNEQIESKAKIEIEKGILMLIKSKD